MYHVKQLIYNTMAEEIIDAIKYDLVQELCDYGGEDTNKGLN